MLNYSRVKDFWMLLDKYKEYKSLADQDSLWGDLKEYQRLFILDQLIKLPPGSRIVEVGGGVCDVFRAMEEKTPGRYECWTVDPMDGRDGGPAIWDLPKGLDKHVRIVRESFGNFSKEIPDNYFDVLFSLSVMEHVPYDQWEKCMADMARVCKKGAVIIHTIDATIDYPEGPNLLQLLQELPAKLGLKFQQASPAFTIDTIKSDPLAYYVSPTAYMRWLKHMPEGRNTLSNGIYCRVTAVNAVYVKV